jgi:hypothetical protein
VVTDWKFAPGLQDEAMLDGAGDGADVHYFVCAENGGELCVHDWIVNWVAVAGDWGLGSG